MKVAVTGVRGQIVQSLIERAAGRPGFEIMPVGRPHADLAEPGTVARAIAILSPDVVINAAAFTAVDQAEDEPERAFRINADGAGEVAAAARAAGVPVIHISTDYVFDGRSDAPYSEGAATRPATAYGRSKLAGEERVREANPDHMIVRTAWLYSPFGRNFVKTMFEGGRSRDMVSVVNDQTGSPTAALDLAGALLDILDGLGSGKPPSLGATYHLAGSGETSWCGLAEAVMEECRKLGLTSAEVRGIASSEWPTKAERPRNSALDSGKIARELGIRLPDWRKSVADTVRRLAAAG